MTWAYKTDSRVYRCIYYPIDATYDGPPAANCSGGCMQMTYGSGSVQPKMWIDNSDRVPTTLGSAINLCNSLGGHLASERDFTEAIRSGLPNGSNNFLWTWDIGYGETATNTMIVRWLQTDTAYNDQWSTYMTWSGIAGETRPYRCMWTNELR
jgi:hypothetical protein